MSEADGAKAMPRSSESERAVLAAILLSPEVLEGVSQVLDVGDFYSQRHRSIYGAMLEVERAGREVDLRTLQDELERQGLFEQVGGLAYLAGLDLDLPDLSRVETYAEIVRDRATRRRLIRDCHEIAARCFAGNRGATAEILEDVERRILRLRTGHGRGGFRGVASAYDAAVARLAVRAAGGGALRTGFVELDRLTDGLGPGQLVLVAGRPGMGKTAFGLNLAQHVAFRDQLPVAFVSLEMSEEELALRILSSESGLPAGDVRSRRLDEAQWRALYATIENTSGLPLYLDDASAVTVAELASSARRLSAEAGLALLVVDYLQLMEGGPGFESRQLEVSYISRSLKRLAKELAIPVVALSQLSRKAEHREDGRPRLTDLRESGALEQDADLVLFLWRDVNAAVTTVTELIVGKQRNGPTGTVELELDCETATFRDLGGAR